VTVKPDAISIFSAGKKNTKYTKSKMMKIGIISLAMYGVNALFKNILVFNLL
jgi:hypothetical protein